MSKVDFVVIGGGLAGSAVGTLLHKKGYAVALFEKDTMPRDKLCGEFLSPESQKALGEIGCLESLQQLSPAPIRAARFFSPWGLKAEAPLPGTAWGLSRKGLDSCLLDYAKQCGVATYSPATVRSIDLKNKSIVYSSKWHEKERQEILANWIIGAYGRQSFLDKQLGRNFINQKSSLIAFKRHFRTLPNNKGKSLERELQGWVEIHIFPGGYCGFSHIETGEVNVCALVQTSLKKKIGRLNWSSLEQHCCKTSKSLAKRFQQVEFSDEEVHCVSQIPFGNKNKFASGISFLGDSAGMITPVCGDGQAMALSSAVMFNEMLPRKDEVSWNEVISQLEQGWDKRWRKEFNFRFVLGQMIQKTAFLPYLSELALANLKIAPGLFSQIIRWTRG